MSNLSTNLFKTDSNISEINGYEPFVNNDTHTNFFGYNESHTNPFEDFNESHTNFFGFNESPPDPFSFNRSKSHVNSFSFNNRDESHFQGISSTNSKENYCDKPYGFPTARESVKDKPFKFPTVKESVKGKPFKFPTVKESTKVKPLVNNKFPTFNAQNFDPSNYKGISKEQTIFSGNVNNNKFRGYDYKKNKVKNYLNDKNKKPYELEMKSIIDCLNDADGSLTIEDISNKTNLLERKISDNIGSWKMLEVDENSLFTNDENCYRQKYSINKNLL